MSTNDLDKITEFGTTFCKHFIWDEPWSKICEKHNL